MTNTTAEQVKGPRKLKNGNPINISAQFGQPNGNPRHNGCWRKEDTPRYKLEKMMAMTEDELHSVALDKTASLFERKLALAISKADWKTIESMVNQVYGQPKIVQETKVELPEPLVDLRNRKKNGTK